MSITGVKITPISTITKETATEWLRKSIDVKYFPSVWKWQGQYNFNQNQLDALTSFAYNCGTGALNTLLQNGARTKQQIADALPLYNKGINGTVYAGLTRRRATERALFLDTGNFGVVTGNSSVSVSGNDKVKELQGLCNQLTGSNLVIDGIYGTQTDNAVKNLPLAGLPYKTPELTTWIQLRLGCTPDGIYGTKTANAVKTWQRGHGLTVDGLAGHNTIKSLALA
jgi:Phage-related lysozyme (muraminidase)